jgi:4-diphosphocytidyl-2-C-methyl-D-erythritol kinase
MTRAPATAKLNLALVVGRPHQGRHQLTTVYQRLDLVDRIAVAPAPRLRVTGFPEDTLVGKALEGLAAAAGVPPRWEARLTKRIPVAAGLGGGSSDAATALRLANETLDEPLVAEELRALAAKLGADVPFFLTQGPQLGESDGTLLTPLDLPQDYWVVLVLPRGASKQSSGAVYAVFDEREGPKGYRARRAALKRTLRSAPAGLWHSRRAIASSPCPSGSGGGAFRADMVAQVPACTASSSTGSGPKRRPSGTWRGQTWVVTPVLQPT